ncbi:peptidylprolyl isomerase [Kaarinaea lacus]
MSIFKASIFRKFVPVMFVLLCWFALFGFVYAEEIDKEASKAVEDDYFAIINNETIPLDEFVFMFRKAVKEKFYHGKVEQDKVDAFRKEVAERLVTQILLDKDARRRGLKPDEKEVQAKIDKIDARFANTDSDEERDNWEENRDKVLPIIKARIERDELVELLNKKVKEVDPPSKEKIQEYYENNKSKFTEPEEWDVSIILLSVDPSSSSDVWQETVEQAERLLKKIRKGESFEDLARIHSGDESAVNGGHMGYLHLGMLGRPAQQVLNVLEPGEISEPVVLLEGVAIFKLNDVQKPHLNTLQDVQERAKNLLIREMGEQAWKDLVISVRDSATVKFGKFVTQSQESEEKKAEVNS